MLIEFSAEAGDSYNTAVLHLAGYTADVTHVEDLDGVTERCVTIIGPDYDAGWYGTIRVREFNEATGEAEGGVFSIVAEKIVVC
jgi:hypothetical protein